MNKRCSWQSLHTEYWSGSIASCHIVWHNYSYLAGYVRTCSASQTCHATKWRQVGKHRDLHLADEQTDLQTDGQTQIQRQTGRQASKQAGRRMDRQAGRHSIDAQSPASVIVGIKPR